IYTYNANGQVLISVNARGYGVTNVYDDTTGNLQSSSDAFGNTTTYRYNSVGFLTSWTDPLGTVRTNVYDDSGNLLGTAVLSVQSSFPPITNVVTILSTNSFAYDENGNLTGSVAWRRIGTNWTGATNTYVLDAVGRAVQSIAPDGGTNLIVYDT